MVQFASMASAQVEEHLAEYLSGRVAPWESWTTADEIRGAFTAWERTLVEELPAIEADPDRFAKAMMLSLEALHLLWKALNYYAAQLRSEDTFALPSDEVASLNEWQKDVTPWWDEYTHLLGEIPMTTAVDVAATDAVVMRIAELLQRWALGVGFDYHDTPRGGWFQITRWT